MRQNRYLNILAMLLLTLVVSCESEPGSLQTGEMKEPASLAKGNKGDAGKTAIVERVHETEEWQRIATTLKETRKYYSIKRTWSPPGPAKISEEKRMEKALVLALYDIQRLVEMRGLSQADAVLLKEQIVEMPHVGNFRSRNVRYDDMGVWVSETHYDGTRCNPKGISRSPKWMNSALADVMPQLYVGMLREELDALLVKYVVPFRTINHTYYLFADGYIILPPEHLLNFVTILGDGKPHKWHDRWHVEHIVGKRQETTDRRAEGRFGNLAEVSNLCTSAQFYYSYSANKKWPEDLDAVKTYYEDIRKGNPLPEIDWTIYANASFQVQPDGKLRIDFHKTEGESGSKRLDGSLVLEAPVTKSDSAEP